MIHLCHGHTEEISVRVMASLNSPFIAASRTRLGAELSEKKWAADVPTRLPRQWLAMFDENAQVLARSVRVFCENSTSYGEIARRYCDNCTNACDITTRLANTQRYDHDSCTTNCENATMALRSLMISVR